MVAYVIADNKVTDPERYAEYAKLGGPTIAQYGGKVLARGGHAERLGGSWEPNRIVIIQFDSVEQAKAWSNSAEYEAAKKIRDAASDVRTIVVEGA